MLLDYVGMVCTWAGGMSGRNLKRNWGQEQTCNSFKEPSRKAGEAAKVAILTHHAQKPHAMATPSIGRPCIVCLPPSTWNRR